jgi:hypothetical protein
MAQPLQIYAAGSPTGVFSDIVKAFPARAGEIAAPVFGPALGVLRERIDMAITRTSLPAPTWINHAGWPEPVVSPGK